MDIYQSLTILLLAFVTMCQSVDGLIGLRPPPKHVTQDEKKEKKVVKPTTAKPTYLHPVQNVTDADITNDIHHIQCHPVPLLRCSYRLLKDSIQNNSHVCRQAQHFSHCIRSSVREDGRRDFVIGLDILDDFSRTINRHLKCHGNTSLSLLQHTRHQRAKRYGSPCCTDGIIDCAIQTFYKMIYSRVDRCQFVEFYEICLHEVQNTCKVNSISSTFPVFTAQLNRKCNNEHWHRREIVSHTKTS